MPSAVTANGCRERCGQGCPGCRNAPALPLAARGAAAEDLRVAVLALQRRRGEEARAGVAADPPRLIQAIVVRARLHLVGPFPTHLISL